MKNKKLIAIFYAFLAAVFYAVNTPFSKILLQNIAPTFMASLLYLGAGIGVGLMYLFHIKSEEKQSRLNKQDMPYAIAMVVLDIAAPILLMTGISIGTASNAALLGNFEIVATALIALLIFKEAVSKRLFLAIMFITAASVILSFEGGGLSFSIGSLFVLGATVCWGLENNCTRTISHKSTYQIVTVKGIFSGLGAFLTALILREPLPQLKYAVFALALGFVAYGLSIFTYVRAQRVLGAAKTGAYYAVAPFISVLFSVLLLRESLSSSYML
ncbi:MAG: DMT family transporter, partial [Clostridia bacterium]|nr:DMT family transporter [Clostridia bacterium]